MKKYLFLVVLISALFSCNKKSKVEKAIEEIPVNVKVVRFEKAFFDAAPGDLPKLKENAKPVMARIV
jgi:hypothetical protein